MILRILDLYRAIVRAGKLVENYLVVLGFYRLSICKLWQDKGLCLGLQI